LSKIIELSNLSKDDTSAFYTRKDIIFSIIKDLPDFKKKDIVNILEPSV
jgi:DNA (cytosine-5)-methyltransferase 1